MNILKEPFFHFLIIGLVIFAVHGYLNRGISAENEIIITNDDIFRITTLYKQNWNIEPDEETLQNLISQYVDAEILYKEGLKLNLDHNDEIIKRRLKQKYEFVAQDLADLNTPSEKDLFDFYNENRKNYKTEKQFSFIQYYINPDLHIDPSKEAQRLYQSLKKTNGDKGEFYGDQSHIPRYQAQQAFAGIRRNFGDNFSNSIANLESKGWHPPIQSGLGYHVVYVEEIFQEAILPLESVKSDVEMDWRQDNRKKFADLLISGLRKEYKVIIENQD